MKWQDYFLMYKSFVLSMSQNKLLALVAEKSLEDFPANLPDEWAEKIIATFRQLGDALILAATEAQEKGNSEIQIQLTGADATTPNARPRAPDDADIILASINVMIHMPRSLPMRPEFASLVFAQHLAMSFAHLGAFMSDSARAICYARPSILKSETKKVDWRTIIETGEWNSLFSRLVEEYVYSLGWDSVRSNITTMRDRLGLEFEISNEKIERIDNAELVRHVIVHNGGRASLEYLKRSGRKDIVLGEQLVVSKEFAQAVSQDLLILGGKIFVAASEAHFDKPRNSISGVWIPSATE